MNFSFQSERICIEIVKHLLPVVHQPCQSTRGTHTTYEITNVSVAIDTQVTFVFKNFGVRTTRQT